MASFFVQFSKIIILINLAVDRKILIWFCTEQVLSGLGYRKIVSDSFMHKMRAGCINVNSLSRIIKVGSVRIWNFSTLYVTSEKKNGKKRKIVIFR